MNLDPTLAGLGSGAAGTILLLLVVLRQVRRSRADRPVDEVTLELVDLADLAVLPVELVPGDSDPAALPAALPTGEPQDLATADAESLTVRSLRAQVRTLEETLEQVREVADRIPVLEPPHPPADEEPSAAYRRRVALTLHAFAGHPDAAHEPPERMLARVAAAVERLDAPDRLLRPVLPAPAAPGTRPGAGSGTGSASGPVLVAPLQEPAVTAEAAAPVAPPVATEPVEPVADEPVAEDATEDAAEQTAAVEPVQYPAPRMVLPVPPPAPVETRRGRKWLRRHDAA